MQPDILERLDGWLANMGIILVADAVDETARAVTAPQRDLLDARNEIMKLRQEVADWQETWGKR